jgi:hypothetical protein
MTKFTKVEGNFKFRSGTPVEGNVYKDPEGTLLTRETCFKCAGERFFTHPAFLRHTAGGIAGGCFSCNARGYHAVRAYPA